MHRFFSENPIETVSVELSGTEHQHMTKVMRLSVGDEVILFDGHGKEFAATIDRIGRQSTSLTITDTKDIDRELPFELDLGVALPKGDRQQMLVEKAVELGVTSVTPLITQRGVAQPGAKAMQRIVRWIVGASKQSRRNRLMQVKSPQSIEQFFAVGSSLPTKRLIAHPDGQASLSEITGDLQAGDCRIQIAIGPEGGFTEDEVELAQRNDAIPVQLGPRILRIETAAIASAAHFVFRSAQ